jgi:pyruvate,water dikinase
LTAEDLTELPDGELADAIDAREEAHERWKKVYKEEFIPFAHGVRWFGQYYYDVLRPEDPFAFVGLLEHQPMMASARNESLAGFADHVRELPALSAWLNRPGVISGARSRRGWDGLAGQLREIDGGATFPRAVEDFLDQHMNLAFQNESLDDRPDLVLSIVRQLASKPDTTPRVRSGNEAVALEREAEFLAAAGPERREEAREMLRVGRLR